MMLLRKSEQLAHEVPGNIGSFDSDLLRGPCETSSLSSGGVAPTGTKTNHLSLSSEEITDEVWYEAIDPSGS
eukprot:12907836-Prorocentrum_lima.AAC.1